MLFEHLQPMNPQTGAQGGARRALRPPRPRPRASPQEFRGQQHWHRQRAPRPRRCPSSGPDSAGPVPPEPRLPAAEGAEAGSRGSLASSGAAASITSPQPAAAAGTVLQQEEVQEMLRFAVPALGLVLADPLQSLIDTACVGQISAVQLAALGPNTAIFNLVFQLFAFLGVATTSTIATNSIAVPALSPEDRAARLHTAQSTLSNSLILAVACGGLAAVALLAQGRAFLAAFSTPTEVVAPALQYLRIRALAGPAVLVMSVGQGACLGQQDSVTPFSVLAVVTLLNAVGDVYLIAVRGAGVAGAAAATAGAQWVGAAYFLWHLWRKGRQKGGIPLRFMGVPQWQTIRPFLDVAVTLFGRTIFGLASYLAMTVAAARLGMLSTAAHQVAMQVFWFASYFPEPLSLAAQSLIARDRYSPQRAAQWAWLLLKAGSMLGLGLAAAVAGVFQAGTWIFTSDMAVQQSITRLTPIAVLAMLLCCPMMMLDGAAIGAGDYQHMPLAVVAGLSLTLTILWGSHRAGLGLVGVWWSLVGFYATRLAAHILHFASRGSASVFAGGEGAGGGLQPAAAAAG